MKLSPADIANLEALLSSGAYETSSDLVSEALAAHRDLIETVRPRLDQTGDEPAEPAEIVFSDLRARLERRIAGDAD
ncbi:MAG: hypothetical protein ACOC0V_03455 [Oceanicaulis sp.]